MIDEEVRAQRVHLRWFWAIATLELADALDRLFAELDRGKIATDKPLEGEAHV